MPDPLADHPPPPEAVPQLRFLKALVTFLAVVMAFGITAIVALLWLRLGPGAEAPAAGQGLPPLPAQVVLPQGAAAEAITFARDWTIVVTTGGEVLVYDRAGALTRRMTPGS